MANTPGRCWMDEDGRHVWWRHTCVDGERTTMLPHMAGGWRAENGRCSPSIVCTIPGCNYHEIPAIDSEPPADWQPRSAFLGPNYWSKP